MPRRVVGALVDHSLEQVADGLPRQLRGITGSSALKRHVLCDLDTELVCAVGVTAAKVAEAEVADQITADLDAQQRTLEELDIDRAYLSSSLVRDRPDDL